MDSDSEQSVAPEAPKKEPAQQTGRLLIFATVVVALIALFVAVFPVVHRLFDVSYCHDTYEEFKSSRHWGRSSHYLLPMSARQILSRTNIDHGSVFLAFDFSQEDRFFKDCQLLKKGDLKRFSWHYTVWHLPEFVYVWHEIRANRTVNFRCRPVNSAFPGDVFLAVERFGPRAYTRAYIWDFGNLEL